MIKMGASESVCHQHHSHSSQEEAEECNRRVERELILQKQQAAQTFLYEAQKKNEEYMKQKMKTLEKKADILSTLLRSNLDLRDQDHQTCARNLIFEDSSVAAAMIGVVKDGSLTLVGWARNPMNNGQPNRFLEY